MSLMPIAAIFCGAGLGALLRWVFAIWLNPVFPTIPLGTVAANLVGGFLIGVASSFFTHRTGIALEWRLFAITGFLGGLTTFSTFSVEVVTMLARGAIGWAMATAGVHLVGSLALTALGIAAANALFARG